MDEFLNEAYTAHGDFYDYSQVSFDSVKDKILIGCPIHGIFEQEAGSHLSGCGCPKCSGTEKSNTEEFIGKVNIVHDYKYDYSETDYTGNKNKVTIKCKSCGNVFDMKADNHLTGKQGCPSCANYGFNKAKPATLYYLSINNGEAYKIGITNNSVKRRFNNTDLEKIEIINEWQFSLGSDAKSFEDVILKVYKEYKYTGKWLLANGNTELFNKDILGLDKHDGRNNEKAEMA